MHKTICVHCCPLHRVELQQTVTIIEPDDSRFCVIIQKHTDLTDECGACVRPCVRKAGEKASHRSLMTTVPSGVKNRTCILSCLLSLHCHCWAITCFWSMLPKSTLTDQLFPLQSLIAFSTALLSSPGMPFHTEIYHFFSSPSQQQVLSTTSSEKLLIFQNEKF